MNSSSSRVREMFKVLRVAILVGYPLWHIVSKNRSGAHVVSAILSHPGACRALETPHPAPSAALDRRRGLPLAHGALGASPRAGRRAGADARGAARRDVPDV